MGWGLMGCQDCQDCAMSRHMSASQVWPASPPPQGPPNSTLISQPPHDYKLNNASMYHYTWCACCLLLGAWYSQVWSQLHQCVACGASLWVFT